MGIHRAHFALAMIALAGLAGCQSGSSNSLAFWKSNPLSSKTAASTPKPQYPPKPSTQVAIPGDVTAPANGLAASPAVKSSATYPGATKSYPGATTSFTAPSGSLGGTSPAMAGIASSGRGTPAGSAAAIDPVVSPQRGYYSSPSSSAGSRPTAAGVSTPSAAGSYASMDPAAGRSTASPGTGFRSGAKDYTSPATDYTASSNTGSTRSGAIIPRYGASADRYGAAADRTAAPADRASPSADRFVPSTDRTVAGADRYGSGSRPGAAYDPITPARASSPSPFGPTASAASLPPASSRSATADPFQASNRTSPYSATSTPGSDRGASPYGAAGAASGDRNSGSYANPYASSNSARPSSPAYDRPGTPNYRDYPSTDTLAPRTNTAYNPPAGSYAPATNGSSAPPSDYRPTNGGYNAPAGDYRPGATGYNPPASDYRPGDTGYNPPNTSPYRAPSGSATPSGSAPATDDAPPFRPGSTSDYVPKSANPSQAASTAARVPFNSRVDTSVRPTGYDVGGSDYRR